MTLLTPEELEAIKARAQDEIDPGGESVSWSVATDEPSVLMNVSERVALRSDRVALLSHIDALTPRWRDGEPPNVTDYVWREEALGGHDGQVVRVEKWPNGPRYAHSGGFPRAWGTARWCPIRGPG